MSTSNDKKTHFIGNRRNKYMCFTDIQLDYNLIDYGLIDYGLV